MTTLDARYDAINRAIFLPWGGSRRLRRGLVDALDVRAGARALELGCGTGLVTELLVAAGATVTGIDAMEEMIAGARRRAPGARLIVGDVTAVDLGADFDRVVVSFVLHNLDAAQRVRLLRRAAAVLAPGGRIGILEWALPAGTLRRRQWRWFVRRLEPSSHAAEVLDGRLEDDLRSAGLTIRGRRAPTGGRTQILVLERKADVGAVA